MSGFDFYVPRNGQGPSAIHVVRAEPSCHGLVWNVQLTQFAWII